VYSKIGREQRQPPDANAPKGPSSLAGPKKKTKKKNPSQKKKKKESDDTDLARLADARTGMHALVKGEAAMTN